MSEAQEALCERTAIMGDRSGRWTIVPRPSSGRLTCAANGALVAVHIRMRAEPASSLGPVR
ncbi:hypothetical protein GCM10010472_01890 [Pseudonocardia halophobica]|uniref:Uncharacterized protein n=1 Tax=Pseudonocardia halophobica TaxID=29401 RepID=A0A9W6NV64_9PSEU|nr:hypothetical protein GCM10017577_16690 [Pseudonocardia halophobica]